MSEDTPNFSISDDYDPDHDMTADSEPLTEYLTFRSHVAAGATGEMNFPGRFQTLHC
jgi:hypothetical protein